MKILSVFVFYLLATTNIACAHTPQKEDPFNFKVEKTDYTFSIVFDMARDKNNFGSVVKSVFHIGAHYDSYDRFGLYEGQGVCRMPLSLLCSWAAAIDIYNSQGTKIGLIDGQMIATEPAKYGFYDEKDNLLCVALLGDDRKNVTIIDSIDPTIVVAQFTHDNSSIDTDRWEISCFHPEKLPLKFLKVFAAFICDTETKDR